MMTTRDSHPLVLARSQPSMVRWSVAFFSGGVALLKNRLIVPSLRFGGRGAAPGARINGFLACLGPLCNIDSRCFDWINKPRRRRTIDQGRSLAATDSLLT